MIKINDEFTLLNLDTNEEEKFKLVQYTQDYVPIAMAGAYGDVTPAKAVPTTNAGTYSDGGALIISNKSKLGKAVSYKNLSDEISYEIDNGVYAKFRVVEINGKRQLINAFPMVHLPVYEDTDSGLDLYKTLKEKGEFPVIEKTFWSDEFCFVVEDVIEKDGGKKCLLGTTFKEGMIYQRNKEYDADLVFRPHYGNYRSAIINQYKYVVKLVLKERNPNSFDDMF